MSVVYRCSKFSHINWLNISLVICACILFLPVQSQINTSETNILVNEFQALKKKVEQESIYIQTNKGIYETGEDVWFKAYVLDSQSFIPSDLSEILFVQLISDKTKRAVWEEKYEIKSGFVDGHLYINDTLSEGKYTLSVYTKHSFYDNSSDFYAVKNLNIVKRIDQKTEIRTIKLDSILHFESFPEGGHLISGIPNTLAFKASDSKGFPLEVSGILYENSLPLLEFNSQYAGMGSLSFVPYAYKKYHIRLKNSSEDKIYELPKIHESGMVLQLLYNTEDTLALKITQIKEKKQKIYLRTQVRGLVYSIATANLENEQIIKLPLNDMPQGIAEVTVFNESFIPLAERLVFIKQEQKFNISTILDKREYQTRGKVALKIKVTDENGQPVVAHLGLSVYDRIYNNEEETNNILSYYFLSTQLKGNIYNPSYYFNPDNKNSKKALDLLLLTQGWRKYVWNDSNLQKTQLSKQVFSDEIQGNVRINEKNVQVGQPLIMSYIPGKIDQNNLISVDSLGAFFIEPKHLKTEGSSYVYVRLMVSKNQKYFFSLDNNTFKSIDQLKKAKTIYSYLPKLNEENEEHLEFYGTTLSHEINKLEELILEAKKRRVNRDKYLTQLDSLAKLEMTTDYVCKHNILNCPIHVIDKENKRPVEGEVYYVLKVWNNDLKQYIEGVAPQPGQGFINPPLPPYKYPLLTDTNLLKMFNIIRIKGYYGSKQFYEPIYDEQTINDSFPDYRNTLVWKPEIITDDKGEAFIEFFCSDINTVFLGVVEGVSGEGLLGSNKFEIIVRQNQKE